MPTWDYAFCWRNWVVGGFAGAGDVSLAGLASPTFEMRLYETLFALYGEMDVVCSSYAFYVTASKLADHAYPELCFVFTGRAMITVAETASCTSENMR